MRRMIWVMVYGIRSRQWYHLRGIDGMQECLKPKVVACDLDPDLVPRLEGVKNRHQFNLVFIDFVRLWTNGILESMKRLPRF